MKEESLKPDPYAALRIRDFRFFIICRLVITIAFQMQAVIIGWQVFELTHDTLSLGFIGLAEAIPSISVSLYAGHLSDRKNRKKITLITLIVLSLCACALLILSFYLKEMYPKYGVTPLYTLIFISGL